MENWIVYAIVSLFLAGFFNFGMKVISKRNYNTSYVSFIAYIAAAIMSAVSYFSSHSSFELIDGLLILFLLALGDRLFYFFSTLSRVESLHSIDTTIFFPLYKTFFPIILTVISYFFLNEALSLKEFIGIIFGITVPLLLITKKEDTIQKNLKRGIFLIILTSIFGSIATLFTKMVHVLHFDLDLFLLISFVLGIGISFSSFRLVDKKSAKQYSNKGIYVFSILLGVVQFISFYAFATALSGNLAIAVTINSFSILIPIILSVIFYKEEMTFKKAFVIFLSIVSVILFI